jgi:anti-sigma factor RsiW
MFKDKHISNNLIIALLSGELDNQKEIVLIEKHLDKCDRCFHLWTDFSISNDEIKTLLYGDKNR